MCGCGDESVGSFGKEESGGEFFQPSLSGLGAIGDGMAEESGQLSCVRGEKKRAGGSGEESGMGGNDFEGAGIEDKGNFGDGENLSKKVF
jgi:hypothetical protein